MEPVVPSWGDLPAELWLRFLANLPLEDVCRAQRVCKRLKDLVNDAQPLWRELYRATFGAVASSGDAEEQQQGRQAGGGGLPRRDGGRSEQRSGSQGEEEGQRQQPGSSSGATNCRAGTAAAAQAALSGTKRQRSGAAAPVCFPGTPAGSARAPPAEAPPALDGAAIDWRARFKSRCGEHSIPNSGTLACQPAVGLTHHPQSRLTDCCRLPVAQVCGGGAAAAAHAAGKEAEG
jgi:hypothetical protein